MKTRYLFILLTLLIPASLYAQDCQVLLPAIAGKYEGDCNKGKASGKGSSQGKDKYTGEFADGLPSGEGTYTWADGTTYTGSFAKGKMEGKGSMTYKISGKADSVVTGYWKKDVYQGTSAQPYLVGFRSKRVDRVEVLRDSKADPSENTIIINIQSMGVGNTAPTLIISQGSYTQIIEQPSSGRNNVSRLLNVVYPFKTRIRMGSEETDILISQPGVWKVNIFTH